MFQLKFTPMFLSRLIIFPLRQNKVKCNKGKFDLYYDS